MDDPLKTWALVVGIDQYDNPSIGRLTGAVADAVEAIDWLGSLGVPAANIRLNVSPQSDPRISRCGIPATDAKLLSIWKSINDIANATGTERLFVFFSGHGIYNYFPPSRLFLTQEYSVQGNWSANLDIAKYIDYFLSLNFRRQFLFFDGCQNYGSGPTQLSQILPNPPLTQGYSPQAQNGLVACFAATQGQRAVEIGGRGAMMRRLLPELDGNKLNTLLPYDQRHNSIQYDWSSGKRHLDLKLLFDSIVKNAVTQDVKAFTQNLLQTPLAVPYEAATRELVPILELLPETTSTVKVDVTPSAGTSAVDQIRVRVKLPLRDRFLPEIPNPLSLPDTCHVPLGADVEPFCFLLPNAVWQIKEVPPGAFKVNNPSYDLLFELEQIPQLIGGAPLSQSPPDLDLANIRIIGTGATLTGLYEKLAQQYQLDMPTEAPSPDGITMILHEHGPDFVMPPGQTTTSDLVTGWARAISQEVPNHGIVIAPPGRTMEQSLPNLEFKMPEGGARRLAGYLTEFPLVAIEPGQAHDRGWLWDVKGDYSVAALQDLRVVRARRGRNRIRVDMPWGSWTGFVDVPDAGKALCELPEAVGLPPLRNAAPAECPEYGYVLARGQVREFQLGEHRIDAQFNDHGWTVFRISDFLWRAHTQTISIEHAPHGDDRRHVRLILPGATDSPPRTMLVDLEGHFPRVEPYSKTHQIEWDLIVSTGRLDTITPKMLFELCAAPLYGKEHHLFQLGIAYAACAAQLWHDLGRILTKLSDEGCDLLDLHLLDLQYPNRLDGRHTEEVFTETIDRLRSGQLPIFRWGITLAHQLFKPDDPSGNPVQSIAARISPASIWTTWVDDLSEQG
jgi:hypothetical protein